MWCYATCKFDKRNESFDKALFIYYPSIRCPFGIADDVGVNSLNIYDWEKCIWRSLEPECHLPLATMYFIQLSSFARSFFFSCSISIGIAVLSFTKLPANEAKTIGNQSELRRQLIWLHCANIRGQHDNWCHRIIYHICILLLYSVSKGRKNQNDFIPFLHLVVLNSGDRWEIHWEFDARSSI